MTTQAGNENVTITSFEVENVKRVKTVRMQLSPVGLTVIGGDNFQGKTSVLDAICYALGGEKRRPSNVNHEGGDGNAKIHVELSNGLIVERKGKNAALTVTDPSGGRHGQTLLDSFIEQLALDLPRFLMMSGKEKASVLLQILGIGDKLADLDRQEKAAYDSRTAQGRIADANQHLAQGLPSYPAVPNEPIVTADLINESVAIMERNKARDAHRQRVQKASEEYERRMARVKECEVALNLANDLAATSLGRLVDLQAEEVTSDEDLAEVRAKLAQVETINDKVRANAEKRKAQDEADTARKVYEALTAKVEAVRIERMRLLENAEMPLSGLSVVGGELTYNGKAWDCMASAEQIRAAMAIVRRLRPECGFVLADGLERLDRSQIEELNHWLQAEHMQCIATRVSRGDECTVIIEDGMIAGASTA